jgi:hypothetical protein
MSRLFLSRNIEDGNGRAGADGSLGPVGGAASRAAPVRAGLATAACLCLRAWAAWAPHTDSCCRPPPSPRPLLWLAPSLLCFLSRGLPLGCCRRWPRRAVRGCRACSGLTFAVNWSALSTHCARVAPVGMAAATQQLLNTLHWGLARGIGAAVGGRILGEGRVPLTARPAQLTSTHAPLN